MVEIATVEICADSRKDHQCSARTRPEASKSARCDFFFTRIFCLVIAQNRSKVIEEKNTLPNVIPMEGIWMPLAIGAAVANKKTAKFTLIKACFLFIVQ